MFFGRMTACDPVYKVTFGMALSKYGIILPSLVYLSAHGDCAAVLWVFFPNQKVFSALIWEREA